MTWFSQLLDRLEDQKQRPREVQAGDGRLLLAEHGARILGIELPGLEQNLIFHTDATAVGRLTGGDRVWIAPEVGWFWPSLAEARRDPKSTAAVPPQLDPGDYRSAAASEKLLALESSLTLRDVRDSRSISLNLKRTIAAIDAPDVERSNLARASFSITHTLTATAGDPGAVAGAWSILMLPPTGTLICPVTAKVDPRSYYDPFGDRHVHAEPGRVRFLIDGKRRIKMGLRPEHSTGRMGYYRPIARGLSTLIVRIFPALPGEPYVDIPRDHPADQRRGGDLLQAYNDDGDAFPGTSFGEMEYHDPAVIVGRGATRTGTSVTHCFAGPDNAVRAIGQELLGVLVEPIA